VPGGDVTPALAGAWRTNVDPYTATYQFDGDGKFVLTFALGPRSPMRGGMAGRASGTWKLDGHALVMTNTQSDTPFTQVGEEERADVAGLDEHTLVLDTTNRKGKPEQIVLRRVVPFARGKHDDDKIVGTWNGEGITLVLADSGLAVLMGWKGEWSQHGKTLTMLMSTSAQRAGNPGAPSSQPAGGYEKITFNIDLLDDTTLVVTGELGRPEQRTITLLRVK
jgi:hypothetical protein